jgi:hypothetical protein
VQFAAWSKDLRVTADGSGVVSHVGAVLLRMLADRAGLTQALSAGLARQGWWPGHDRGRVLVDLAVMIADGGEAICGIDVLRHQGEVFGPVASAATCPGRDRRGPAAADRQGSRAGPRPRLGAVRAAVAGRRGTTPGRRHPATLPATTVNVMPPHRPQQTFSNTLSGTNDRGLVASVIVNSPSRSARWRATFDIFIGGPAAFSSRSHRSVAPIQEMARWR